jgi:hypothetical protein
MAVRVRWDALNGLTPVAANSFLLNWVPDALGRPSEVILNVGFLPTPVLVGTPEEQLAQVEALGESAGAVRPIIRLTFSFERAQELRQVLNQVLAILESVPSAGRP